MIVLMCEWCVESVNKLMTLLDKQCRNSTHAFRQFFIGGTVFASDFLIGGG